MTVGRPAGVFIVAALLAAGLGHAVLAETGAGRKPAHRSQPAHASQSAPDRTGSVARPLDTYGPPAPLVPEDDASLAFFYLPDAPRPRMRACGESWRARKMAGEAGDENWREFAIKCLAAVDAPASP